MTKKFILPAVMLLGVSGAALAADINGKWTAEVEGKKGNRNPDSGVAGIW